VKDLDGADFGVGRTGETGASEANVECESCFDMRVVCRVAPLGG